MAGTPRSGTLIWLHGIGEGREYRPGDCAWCGEPIVLLNPSDYRRAQRTRHRGDEHEQGGRRCMREFNRARAYTARELVEKRGDSRCIDCGSQGEWHADHDTPLADGGLHHPENIVRRCVGCHAEKTKREAIQRAERRRLTREQFRRRNQTNLIAA